MTVMYSFCLWFPVRLGTVIVGVSAGLQSFACLIASVVGISDLDNTSNEIDRWLEQNDLLITTSFFTGMRDDPHGYLTGFIIAFSVHLFSCALLIFGAYFCSMWMIYPFVGLDFLRLLILSFLLVISILVVKTNTLTLGYVIALSIGGGFFLLYLWYQWFCVLSLCQIIRHVEFMEETSHMTRLTNIPVPSSKGDLSSYPYPLMTFTRPQDVALYNKKVNYLGLPKITQ